MIRWLRERWWSIQRGIDLDVLWPQCKKLASNMDQARAVFASHAFNDAAWVEYYGEDRLVEVIDELE